MCRNHENESTVPEITVHFQPAVQYENSHKQETGQKREKHETYSNLLKTIQETKSTAPHIELNSSTQKLLSLILDARIAYLAD